MMIISYFKNKPESVFPAILIILDICAAIVYFMKYSTTNLKKGIYWLAAAVLTAMVTF